MSTRSPTAGTWEANTVALNDYPVANDWKLVLEAPTATSGNDCAEYTSAVNLTPRWREAGEDREEVLGDPGCAPGSGRFRLLPIAVRDTDDDGTAHAELVPVLQSGDHLSPTGWLTSVKFIDLAGLSLVYLGHQRYPLRWDEDFLWRPHTNAFSPARMSGPIPVGTAGTGVRFGVEELSVDDVIRTPTVDLAWTCGAPGASDIHTWKRPSASRLPLARLGVPDTAQELLMRPDFEAKRMWVELRGRPYDARVVGLTRSHGDSWAFSFDEFGVSGAGTVARTGEGLTLTLDVEDALTRQALVLSPL